MMPSQEPQNPSQEPRNLSLCGNDIVRKTATNVVVCFFVAAESDEDWLLAMSG